jgi:TolB-like protein
MKRRFFLAGVLMLVCALGAFTQTNRRSILAILPFTGGERSEGEAIAELLSFNNQLMDRFGIMPRTSITRAIEQEQNFQMSSGMTDADTIAALGARLGTQYVMAGSITALGSQKILVVTIIEIETGQQVAGEYLTYTAIEELRNRISDIMRNLLPMLDVDTSEKEKLSVLPVQLEGNASARDADTLAQILSISLMRNESYAIYPRTASLDQVQDEFNTQLDSSVTDQRQAAQLGRGDNPKLVLSVAARRLGTLDIFNASIINLEEGTLVPGKGTSEEYANMTDGIMAMDIIARTLSGQSVSQWEQRQRTNAISAQTNREAAERRRAELRDSFNRNAAFTFTFEYGMSIIAKNFIADRIFGEPASEFDNVPDRAEFDGTGNKTGSSPGDASKAPTRMGSLPGVLIGFQYSWFSINAGASFGIKYDAPSQIEYNFVQVPVLLRGDWTFTYIDAPFNLAFDAVVGMGFNIPIKATAQLASVLYGEKRKFDAILTMPPSIIIGAGIGFAMARATLYTDFRGVFDTASTTAELTDGRTGTFRRASFDITMGLKIRVPFSPESSSGAFTGRR